MVFSCRDETIRYDKGAASFFFVGLITMREKPRIERQQEAGSLMSSANGAASNRRLDAGANDPATELAKTRQQLDKALRMTRSLARNCARAEQELGALRGLQRGSWT